MKNPNLLCGKLLNYVHLAGIHTNKQTKKQTAKQKFGCEAEVRGTRKPEVKLHSLHNNCVTNGKPCSRKI